MLGLIENLSNRAENHDNSKMEDPELKVFTEFTPRLKTAVFGSDEYKQFLKDMKPALDHHYAHNSHHPEHHKNGIRGMTLLDLVEMLCDWKASTERTKDGDINKSIEYNKKRFEMSDDLVDIFKNTLSEL